jgi:AhpD family alkylhydroperoxidase
MALTVAEENSCGDCLAAHTFLGKKAGLSEDEVVHACHGTSDEPKVAAALAFASQVVEQRGQVTDAGVTTVRQAGFSDGEIAEMIANVVLNIFTNYFNVVAGVEIDFPPGALAPALTA